MEKLGNPSAGTATATRATATCGWIGCISSTATAGSSPSAGAATRSRSASGRWRRQFPVYRGEYVGRNERIEVPYWLPNLENFTIATDSSTTKADPGVSVPFGYNAGGAGKPEAILVDFDGGTMHVQPGDRPQGRQGGDEAAGRRDGAGEALLLAPDGRLLLRRRPTTWPTRRVEKRLKEFKRASRGEGQRQACGRADQPKDKDKDKSRSATR